MKLTFPNTTTVAIVSKTCKSFSEMRVWLDDDMIDRAAPDGWVQVTTVDQAVALLSTGRVVELSLDNDLSDDDKYGVGMHVVDYICSRQFLDEVDLWPRDGITLHTANSSARDTMTRSIERYAGQIHGVHRTTTSSGKRKFDFQKES